MSRRWSDLARIGTVLGAAGALALTFAGLVPGSAARARQRWAAGRASLGATEREARQTAFGKPYTDAIETIRGTLPERSPYVLVSDGIEIVITAAYDLAPRRPLLLVKGMPSIARVREAVRGKPLPPWTVVLKRGEPAPKLVATASVFGPPSP